MQDALLMSCLKRFGDLPGELERLTERDRASNKSLGQCRAFNQFHDERRCALRVLEPINSGNVRMI